MSTASNAELVKAFRQLYRSGLRAIQYSKPARYVLRDQLRAAFRAQRTILTSEANNSPPYTFDPEAVRRTVWFFNAAAASRETEHHVVENLLTTAFFRRRRAERNRPTWTMLQGANRPKAKPTQLDISKSVYDQYDATVEQLNKSMGLCLR